MIVFGEEWCLRWLLPIPGGALVRPPVRSPSMLPRSRLLLLAKSAQNMAKICPFHLVFFCTTVSGSPAERGSTRASFCKFLHGCSGSGQSARGRTLSCARLTDWLSLWCWVGLAGRCGCDAAMHHSEGRRRPSQTRLRRGQSATRAAGSGGRRIDRVLAARCPCSANKERFGALIRRFGAPVVTVVGGQQSTCTRSSTDQARAPLP